MTELYELDATAQAALVASGQITASELLEAAVARIESVEPRLNALLDRDFDAARTRTRGHLTGPFAGVPFLIKDLVAYPGLRHTFGSRLFAGNVAHEHTPYSQALDAAGLAGLGKTTTTELGLLRRTRRRGAGAACTRQRRRGLDSHPSRHERPVRAQAEQRTVVAQRSRRHARFVGRPRREPQRA